MIAALELGPRLRRAGQTIAYFAAGVPLAVAGLVAVLLLALGSALTPLAGLGLPLLLAAAALSRVVLRASRRVANRVLGTQIPPLMLGTTTSGGPWRRSLAVLADRSLWRAVGVLVLKPLMTVALLAVALVPVVALAWLVRLGVEGIGGLGDVDYVGPWAFGFTTGVVLCVLALPVAVLTLAALDGLHTVLATVVRAALVQQRGAGAAPVRELLAESLGDHSVAVAYWLPDREIFVDEVGRRVQLPDPSSGRAWTAVERDGRRVAAIVHDAALDTSDELVQAAAAASSLALDNERLKADLGARLEELRDSRLRIVAATDAARRRLERDLHDGAQQQLVALALQLRLLRAQVDDEEIGPLVDELSERLSTALAELRELARGIHPSILTDQGLGPALRSLSDRAPLPVECEVELEERLPAPVEAAAYFVVAEGLTNVSKYAQASYVSVAVRRSEGELTVDVADDGVGGAALEDGSGLRGLQDRVAAVDGELVIESPPGGGTRLLARIPAGLEAP